jgi:hypothetical protein
MLYEVNAMYRQIFIDGRPQPDDPNPTWNGYSIAKWDRDTLVIQTTGFRDDLWIDMNGAPLTSAAKMTERLRRPNYAATTFRSRGRTHRSALLWNARVFMANNRGWKSPLTIPGCTRARGRLP